MTDVIRLLPDSVANQIAAGEVIQRPASVVKELVENAVDAGANEIKVIIKDAGKTLIQVVDDACGMSATDARMAFERHATSKIDNADDLFALHTFGFRGEALASIAAIAQIELKSKTENEELGVSIEIHGSEVLKQDTISCPKGTNILVKNLFYNVPARRKFLKSDANELKHIYNEFQRVALAYPDVKLMLHSNGNVIYSLPSDNIRQRIVRLFDKRLGKALIDVNIDTSLIKIKGYIAKPEFAKKTFGDQFFFINNRFMKHPYFHKAVTLAYDELISQDAHPSYFLYFEVAPEKIDINIHPTKTEIKFEDGPAIFQIIRAAVKESLGKHNIVPSIDFDRKDADDIPFLTANTEIKIPTIEVNPDYNPFRETDNSSNTKIKKNNQIDNWENLYNGIKNEEKHINHKASAITFFEKKTNENEIELQRSFIQLKNKYIATPVKSGLMIIDQRRAHERILFEKFKNSLMGMAQLSQQSLFPVNIELMPDDAEIILEIKNELNLLGFDIREFGNNTFVINGTPTDAQNRNPRELLLDILSFYKNTAADVVVEYQEKLSISLAKAATINVNRQFTKTEMQNLVDKLFACQTPNYSPEGKKIVIILPNEDIEKKF